MGVLLRGRKDAAPVSDVETETVFGDSTVSDPSIGQFWQTFSPTLAFDILLAAICLFLAERMFEWVTTIL